MEKEDTLSNPEHTLLNFKKSQPANPVQRQKAKDIMNEFPYELTINVVQYANFLSEFMKYRDEITPSINRFNSTDLGQHLKALPYSGTYTFREIVFYYSDEYKSGNCYFFFKTLDDMYKMDAIFKPPVIVTTKVDHFPTYSYTPSHGWYQDKNIKYTEQQNYVGYQKTIDEILHNIASHEKHASFLKQIDESASINILLYGPPGCGKTSLWKLIVSLSKRIVGVVQHNNIVFGKNVLSPTQAGINTIIIEDFDRWLSIEPNRDISQILNSLDGIDDGSYLRFFTCNDTSLITKSKALTDRFHAVYYIGKPERDAIYAKAIRILSFHKQIDENKLNHFIDLVVEHKLGNIRKLVHYMIKYVFFDNYLDLMIENIDSLDVDIIDNDDIKK